MATIQENKAWDVAPWYEDGDNWNHMAQHSGQHYEKWKQSIVECFLQKYIQKDSTVLELAVGHGRWTPYILKKAKQVYLVDLNPSCISYCKKRFKNYDSISFFVNDGKNLSFIEDNCVDFIWSFDSFVHMEQDVIGSYFAEFKRILKPDGVAVLHHPGRFDNALPYQFLRRLGIVGVYVYQILSLGKLSVGDGWRSDISGEMIQNLCKKNGLELMMQTRFWGDNNNFNCTLYRDYISVIKKLSG